jgi:methylated-DNA-[protein]-cysteine S-methyltransferase
MNLFIDRIPSPIGTILLVSDGTSVHALEFADCEDRMMRALRRHYRGCALSPSRDPGGVRAPLGRYFAGELDALDDIPVRAAGTPFQQTVWTALRGIMPGNTMTYGSLAAQLGIAKACRAVGFANGANPISVIVPCHRVIGSGGDLTGYGGGLERKRWLLAHEGAAIAGTRAT